MIHSRTFAAVAALGLTAGALALRPSCSTTEASAEPIDFNRDVRPILAANCYACHGPDRHKARLRLDTSEGAFRKLRGGRRAIVPGDTQQSTLVRRVSSTDEDEVMPPPESDKKLTPAQIDTLRRWIEQGATWTEHWAYVPPKRHTPPAVRLQGWPSRTLDHFVLARLEKEGLEPSPEADRVTLLRRLSFDLIGLPPTVAEIDAFVRDTSELAYQKQVDRLLRSQHFGERMAVFWLDLVRFADTRGYHSDNPRNVYPYRDYVIRAFNDNLPFDQFTIEQLAGDLLVDSTLGQRVATCYNKLNQTTEESGAQAKEYEAKSSADRVRNVSVVWMGATLGCAECHDHKFDPYQAADFYRMAAFFADIKEQAIADADQGIPVPTPEQEEGLQQLEAQVSALESELAQLTPERTEQLAKGQVRWEAEARYAPPPSLGPWFVIGPFHSPGTHPFPVPFPPEREIALDATYAEGEVKWRQREDWVDGEIHRLQGDDAATYLYRVVEAPTIGALPVSLGSGGGIKVWVNGELIHANDVSREVAPDQDEATLPLRAGANHVLMKITNDGPGYGVYFKALDAGGLPPAVYAALKVPVSERDEEQKAVLAVHYRTFAPELAPLRAQVAELRKRKSDLEVGLGRCLVTDSGAPRIVRVLRRGDWMDTTGDVVQPAIPVYFGRLDTGERRATRLDLAKWIVSRDNPLTARVFVNRLWKLFFGTGISQRVEDLGAMGEPPTHPQLLDWLAVEFMDSGWDIKHMVKLLVMSSTYRQSSVTTAELRERDPYNRLLARQSSWRLDAEMVRDNALAVSGLLAPVIGGPSVKPYQPAGYWMHLSFPKREWVADTGRSQYRRGLYTWWQRSFPHPSLLAFDAPSREKCTGARPRSNIPQQALVLLNDPTYVETARFLAQRVLVEGGASVEARMRWAFRQVVSRLPEPDEVAVLSALLEKHERAYKKDLAAAWKLVSVGQAPLRDGLMLAELAAWTSVARALLNLHETVTRS